MRCLIRMLTAEKIDTFFALEKEILDYFKIAHSYPLIDERMAYWFLGKYEVYFSYEPFTKEHLEKGGYYGEYKVHGIKEWVFRTMDYTVCAVERDNRVKELLLFDNTKEFTDRKALEEFFFYCFNRFIKSGRCSSSGIFLDTSPR
jgi:hypothetical protein